MITKLSLTNFRRHERQDLTFATDDHMVLISGANGVGKSTLVEAVLYALYGEGRHGRRRLDQMIRRGAELEGMEVEVAFNFGGVEYRVNRRREGRLSSAVLYIDGVAQVESPAAVTRAITRVFGMDVVGFKMAVIAQQKELDSLGSLTPAARRAVIGRLLGLDDVTAARDAGRKRVHVVRDTLRRVGPPKDVPELEKNLKECSADLEAYAEMVDSAAAMVAELEASVGAGADIERQFRESEQRLAGAQGALASAKSDLARAERRLSALGAPPEVPEIPTDAATLSDALQALTAEIAKAEAAASEAERWKAATAQMARDRKRINQIRVDLQTLPTDAERQAAQLSLDAAQSDVVAARKLLTEARDAISDVTARAEVALGRVEEARLLSGVCAECGQPITAEHREEIIEKRASEYSTLQAQLPTLAEKRCEAESAVAAAEGSLSEATNMLGTIEAALIRRKHLEGELADLQERLSRDLSIVEVDADPAVLTGLYEWRTALAKVDVMVRRHSKAVAALERYNIDLASARRNVADATKRVAAAEQAVVAAEIPAELVEAMDRLAAERNQLDKARVALADLRVELAKSEGVVASAKRELSEARQITRRIEKLRQEGHVYAAAVDVLETARTRLAAAVKPALTESVSDLLTQLSDGRFDKVRFTDDYDVQIYDRDAFVGLDSLSGGEVDLVALAIRLGLAELVSRRHGTDGTGFLFLDECFGSQDPDRRESILRGLRRLRPVYPQIFLISHVGGLADSCDRVIEVRAADTGAAETIDR